MSTVAHNMLRWFRGAGETELPQVTTQKSLPRSTRHSSGLAEFMRRITGDDKICILDLGQASHINIPYFTQRGARIYNEDILRALQEKTYMVRGEDGVQRLDVAAFFQENFDYPENHFDAILGWDIADYLPEPVVKPLVEKIHRMLKPTGGMLAYFHTKDAGPDAPYFRYHVLQHDTVELAPGPDFRLQRVFTNRHIENLFTGFSSVKFFLNRDNVREVLVVR
jgi:SAM-dependent methyltransferase